MKFLSIGGVVLAVVVGGIFFASLLTQTSFIVGSINNSLMAYVPVEIFALLIILFFGLILGLVYSMFISN